MKSLGTVWLLVLLGACADAVAWARDREPTQETFALANHGYRDWLRKRIGDGDGYGYGDGYGGWKKH